MQVGLISREVVFLQFLQTISVSSDQISETASHQKHFISSGYGVLISLLPGQLSFSIQLFYGRFEKKRNYMLFGIIRKNLNILGDRSDPSLNIDLRSNLTLFSRLQAARTGHCGCTPSGRGQFFNDEFFVPFIRKAKCMFYFIILRYCPQIIVFCIEYYGRLGMAYHREKQ